MILFATLYKIFDNTGKDVSWRQKELQKKTVVAAARETIRAGVVARPLKKPGKARIVKRER